MDALASIQARLNTALKPSRLQIIDDSAAHAGHAGAASGGGHYKVQIASAAFANLRTIAQHRLVYDALGDLMQHQIHALQIEILV